MDTLNPGHARRKREDQTVARKTYFEELRRDAVELYRTTPGATVVGIAADLGIMDGTLSAWLKAAGVEVHRRRPGSRPAQRAGTVHTQVAPALRWRRHRLDLRTLAGDAGLSIATAHRYLHEALDVVATHAPGLDDVLDRAHAAGLPFVCQEGTLIPTDRVGLDP